MTLILHRIDLETFDRGSGRWLMPGQFLVADSDIRPAIGDLVLVDGKLREFGDPADSATAEGARIVGVFNPR